MSFDLPGLVFDMSKIDMAQLEEDASGNLDNIKHLAQGLPTHEEINGNTEIKYDGPLVKLQGRQVVSIGNGLLLIAPPKTGKSQLCEAAVASVVITDPEVKAKAQAEGTVYDMLGFEFIPPVDKDGNIDNRGVIYFDTERTRNQVKRGFERIVKRAKVEKDEFGRIPKAKCVSLFGCMDTNEMKKIVMSYLESGEYCFMIFDQSADGVMDENDLRECKEFVKWLVFTCVALDIGYMVTIHPNPKDQEGKGTGHLGTYLAKKLEAIVNMFFHENGNKDERVVTSESSQGGTRNDDSQINFAIYYSRTEWMFMTSEGKVESKHPWLEKLRAKKWMFEEDFIQMYDAHVNKDGKKKLSYTKGLYKDLIERKIVHVQNGKVMLFDDSQTIKAVEEFPNGLTLEEGHGFDPEELKKEYDVNHFPKSGDDTEEEPF